MRDKPADSGPLKSPLTTFPPFPVDDRVTTYAAEKAWPSTQSVNCCEKLPNWTVKLNVVIFNESGGGWANNVTNKRGRSKNDGMI